MCLANQGTFMYESIPSPYIETPESLLREESAYSNSINMLTISKASVGKKLL